MGPAYYILLGLIKILELNKYDYRELAVSCWTVLTILFVLLKSHKIAIIYKTAKCIQLDGLIKQNALN